MKGNRTIVTAVVVVIVLVLGIVGFLAGRVLIGELDLTEILGGRRRS